MLRSDVALASRSLRPNFYVTSKVQALRAALIMFSITLKIVIIVIITN